MPGQHRPLPPRPEFKYGVYRNIKNDTLYIAPSMTFNANDGVDKWEVSYTGVGEDYIPTMAGWCNRSIPQFLEKFEYVSDLDVWTRAMIP